MNTAIERSRLGFGHARNAATTGRYRTTDPTPNSHRNAGPAAAPARFACRFQVAWAIAAARMNVRLTAVIGGHLRPAWARPFQPLEPFVPSGVRPWSHGHGAARTSPPGPWLSGEEVRVEAEPLAQPRAGHTVDSESRHPPTPGGHPADGRRSAWPGPVSRHRGARVHHLATASRLAARRSANRIKAPGPMNNCGSWPIRRQAPPGRTSVEWRARTNGVPATMTPSPRRASEGRVHPGLLGTSIANSTPPLRRRTRNPPGWPKRRRGLGGTPSTPSSRATAGRMVR